MKKNSFMLLIACLPLFGQCQEKKINQRFNNKIFSKSDWDNLLVKFPNRERKFLLNMNQLIFLKDTISRQLLETYFRNDTISKEEPYCKKCPVSYKFFYPKTQIKTIERVYPIGSLPSIDGDASSRCTYKSGKDGIYPYRVYPLGKIQWSDSLTVVLWAYPQPYEEFYMVTAYILNQKYEKVGHFGFMYSARWRNCENSIAEIMANSEPLSYPIEVTEKGFLLHDKMVGSYYEDKLQEQYWNVEITEKGQFEIVKEKKLYENGKTPLWSKKGYFIKDEDGYINLREKPNNQSKIIEKLANGTTLEILDSSKDWWYVKCLIDKKGYIHKSRIVEGN